MEAVPSYLDSPDVAALPHSSFKTSFLCSSLSLLSSTFSQAPFGRNHRSVLLCTIATKSRRINYLLHTDERLKETLDRLHQQNIQTASSTYASLLRSCGYSKALLEGKQIHAHIMRNGHQQDRFIGNLLIQMYGKCGALEDARVVFDKMHERNVFSWNIMLAAYAQQAHAKEALQLFAQMQMEEVKPDKYTFSTILGACSNLRALAEGRVIHAKVVDGGFESEVATGTALINMYGKCGSLEEGRRVFDRIHQRDVVSWNAMIAAYVQHGHGKVALQLFHQMHLDGVEQDKITFISILGAYSGLAALAEGKVIHARIVDCRFESDVVVGTALLNMYGKCGSLEDACRVFDKLHERNVVSWNAMIAAYTQHGHCKEAFQLFQQMQQEGAKPDKVTFANILGACLTQADLAKGKLVHAMIHASIIDGRFESDVVVGTALVNMYGKCGSMGDAQRVFYKIHQPDLVSWNAMIAAYVQQGYGKEALQLFQKMQQEVVKPNEVTFISILGACSILAALAEGKIIHAIIIDCGFERELVVATALVNMYGKCGNVEDAWRVFDKMDQRNVISWNAMIAAYSQHGYGKEAIHLFRQMQLEGVKPNESTFVSILCACSHAGLVEEGNRYFISMIEDYGIGPMPEHYCCMIDLFGRAGQLNEAEDFIKRMPIQPNAVAWLTLLGACKIQGDVERAKLIAEHVLELDPQNAAPYVLLSNIYAADGKWDEVAKVRKLMSDNGSQGIA